MPYPTVDQVKQMLLADQAEQVVDDFVLGGVPFAFKDSVRKLEAMRAHIATKLKVNRDSIDVIGSGKTGFSLAPDKAFQPFRMNSDIDVVVIDQELFDHVWLTLLRWNYPLRHTEVSDKKWADRRRREIFWGYLHPDRVWPEQIDVLRPLLKPLRDLSVNWFNTFQSLGNISGLSRHAFSGRLYRTTDHARLYQLSGLADLTRQLRTAT